MKASRVFQLDFPPRARHQVSDLRHRNTKASFNVTDWLTFVVRIVTAGEPAQEKHTATALPAVAILSGTTSTAFREPRRNSAANDAL